MFPQTKLRQLETDVAPAHCDTLHDLRFCALLRQDHWNSLPRPIRRRFSKRVTDGKTIVYVGNVVETRINWLGWLIAQAARLFGGPLPTASANDVPAIVTVTEDHATGGQIWTRLYARRKGFPQVIHSSKRFSGSTGLEELVGGGIGMALTVHVEHGALVFRSAHYFVRIGWLEMTLPTWLTPGALTVTHAEDQDGRFSFLLEVVHPQFGRIVRQLAIFREALP
jgi:hypothetical protein